MTRLSADGGMACCDPCNARAGPGRTSRTGSGEGPERCAAAPESQATSSRTSARPAWTASHETRSARPVRRLPAPPGGLRPADRRPGRLHRRDVRPGPGRIAPQRRIRRTMGTTARRKRTGARRGRHGTPCHPHRTRAPGHPHRHQPDIPGTPIRPGPVPDRNDRTEHLGRGNEANAGGLPPGPAPPGRPTATRTRHGSEPGSLGSASATSSIVCSTRVTRPTSSATMRSACVIAGRARLRSCLTNDSPDRRTKERQSRWAHARSRHPLAHGSSKRIAGIPDLHRRRPPQKVCACC